MRGLLLVLLAPFVPLLLGYVRDWVRDLLEARAARRRRRDQDRGEL